MNIAFEYISKIRNIFFLNKVEDQKFFHFFRISIGLFCLFHFLSFSRDFYTLYISDSIVTQDIMKIQKPWLIPNIKTVLNSIATVIHLPIRTCVIAFITIYSVLCIALTSGLLTRPSAFLLLILHIILSKGSSVYAYGVDYFTTIALFYSVIFPLGQTYSLDKLLFKKEKTSKNPSPYRRILQIHLCIVYFAGGIEKLLGVNWRNGESFWKSLHLPGFTSLFDIDFSFLATFPVLAIVAGWFVILLELLYPYYIWNGKYRNYGLSLICVMHVGILVGLGLYFFSALMIILNLTAFLDLRSSETK